MGSSRRLRGVPALLIAGCLIDGGFTTSAAVPTPDWIADGDLPGAGFGTGVAIAGDINGDGFDDVVVGAPGFPDGSARPGAVFLFLGSQDGLSTTPVWTAVGDQDASRFGLTVASAGDVNGDGYVDILVGAPFYDGTLADRGRAFLYTGSTSGLSTTAAWMIEGDRTGALLGSSVGSAHDVNGDGFGDVIVGAYSRSGAFVNDGRVAVFLGSPSGLASTPTWVSDGGQLGAFFGYSVSAGDLNGDGFGDIVVGSLRYTNGENEEGAVFVFPGSLTGPGTAAAVLEGNVPGAEFGSAVDADGDVNGDGIDDLLVGAQAFISPDLGFASVFLGSPAGLGLSPAWTRQERRSARYGMAAIMAGDIDADGFSEVLIGDDFFLDSQKEQSGAAFLYRGSSSGPARRAEWSAEGGQHGCRYGYDLSGGGDVNGDGFDDVLVGAGSFDNGQTDEGRVFLYLGPRLGLRRSP